MWFQYAIFIICILFIVYKQDWKEKLAKGKTLEQNGNISISAISSSSNQFNSESQHNKVLHTEPHLNSSDNKSIKKDSGNLTCLDKLLSLQDRVNEADLIFVGRVKWIGGTVSDKSRRSTGLKEGPGGRIGGVHILHFLKGKHKTDEKDLIVEGFESPLLCSSESKVKRKWIFLVSKITGKHVGLISSLIHPTRRIISRIKRLIRAPSASPLIQRDKPYEIKTPLKGQLDPCYLYHCNLGSVCVPSLDRQRATCQCPSECSNYGKSLSKGPVCGSDGVNYENECELLRRSCHIQRRLIVKYKGLCDPCEEVECTERQVCQLGRDRRPMCRCNDVCDATYDPVCSSDGKTYANECVMMFEGCKRRRPLSVIYRGKCSAEVNPCESVSCLPGEECNIDGFGIARCECPPPCEAVVRPVCGSDGVTYDNQCELWRTVCVKQRNITIIYSGMCGIAGPCSNFVCDFGAVCVERQGRAECLCPECPAQLDPVCGTDGLSYDNECFLRERNCRKRLTVDVRYRGKCGGCEQKVCMNYGVCRATIDGLGTCICPDDCPQVPGPVCGSNGVTYLNDCLLRADSCKQDKFIEVASRGDCDLCKHVICKYGARCESGECVCPTTCHTTREPVCASNAVTYLNECEMEKASCRMGRGTLRVVFFGECAEARSSGITGGDPCTIMSCEFGSTCIVMNDGLPRCTCTLDCSDTEKNPVCASDLKMYPNECTMYREACQRQTELRLRPLELCEDYELVPCHRSRPLVNPVTGRDYYCGEGPDKEECPSDSYCHWSLSFAKCCPVDENKEKRNMTNLWSHSCEHSHFGCCPDGKTEAYGSNFAGCPSICQCHKLGAYEATCDPITNQCHCKPGVGGTKCDRCEPGYWGLSRIQQGTTGCQPCSCSLFGSVRDDCEQMTGQCVCKPGIGGKKCNICPAGSLLGPKGCYSAKQNEVYSAHSCADLECYFGAKCHIRDGRPECLCDVQCPSDSLSATPVCGSDGETYGSECHLKLYACRYQKDVVIGSLGPCPPLKASARLDSKVEPATPCANSPCRNEGICKPLSGASFICECPFNATGPLCESSALPLYKTPAFNGESFLQLKKMKAYNKVQIELEFRSFTNSGLLVYAQQKDDGSGDYLSLALIDGYIEFRYDLGSGPVHIRSHKQITSKKFHKVIAKRYERDGLLQIDNEEASKGQAPGYLRSLDLKGYTHIGSVQNSSKRIWDNIGTDKKFIGCLRKVIINEHSLDLIWPRSPDVLHAENVKECTSSPCYKTPCYNEGQCKPVGDIDFKCFCYQGFSGNRCEFHESPCKSNPCQVGATCHELLPKTFSCKCPPGRTGKLCQIVEGTSLESFSPEFIGNSFLQLPTPFNVERYFSIELWFLPKSPNGLILYSGQLAENGDYIALSLSDGYVQFAYNLGSGAAFIESKEAVKMNTWQTVHVRRRNRNGVLQLGQGQKVRGTSGPRLTLLNLDLPLYIGGLRNWSILTPELKISQGFYGAIQKLVINGETTKNLMSEAQLSESIKEYRGPPCDENLCENGGMCHPYLNQFICKCTKDFGGKFCEQKEQLEKEMKAVRFDGTTYLHYSINQHYKTKNSSRKRHPEDYWGLDPPMPWSNIDLLEPSVTNEDTSKTPEDFLFLYSDSDYDQEKSEILSERREKENIQDDRKRETKGVVKVYDRETFFHDIGYYSDHTKAIQNASKPYHGITNPEEFYDSMTKSEIPVARSTQKEIKGRYTNHFSLQIRPNSGDGLVLWLSRGNPFIESNYLAIALSGGFVEFTFTLSKDTEPMLITSKVKINDGRWHNVTVYRRKRVGILQIDSEPPIKAFQKEGSQVFKSNNRLWIGGTSRLPSGLPPSFYIGFKGCIRYVQVDNREMHLTSHSDSRNFKFCDSLD